MNDIKTICDFIIERANKEREENILSAKRSVEEKVKEALNQNQEIIDRVEREENLKYDKEMDMTKSKVNMAINKIALCEKNAILDEIFEKVIENLCNLDRDSYQKLIKKLLEKYAKQGDEIILSKDTKASEDFVKSLEVYNNLGLKLSEQTKDIKGGFVLSNSEYDMVVSFESLVEEYKEENFYEIIKKLF
ncbi:MAG: hypothetical protein IJW82_03520 [Clostridia bacterium]|nr:hypothetical protein [Clostridia bacterium]